MAVGRQHALAVLWAEGHRAAVGADGERAVLGEAVAAGLLPEDGVLHRQRQLAAEQHRGQQQLVPPVVKPACSGEPAAHAGARCAATLCRPAQGALHIW